MKYDVENDGQKCTLASCFWTCGNDTTTIKTVMTFLQWPKNVSWLCVRFNWNPLVLEMSHHYFVYFYPWLALIHLRSHILICLLVIHKSLHKPISLAMNSPGWGLDLIGLAMPRTSLDMDGTLSLPFANSVTTQDIITKISAFLQLSLKWILTKFGGPGSKNKPATAIESFICFWREKQILGT